MLQVLSVMGLVLESVLSVSAVHSGGSGGDPQAAILLSTIALLPAACYTADQILKRIQPASDKPLTGVALPETWNLPILR